VARAWTLSAGTTPSKVEEWYTGNGFTDRDIADFIVREIESGRIPGPTDWQEKPIYLVILPQGLFSKDHFNDAVGLHFHF
jgi:hypothetical protein